MSQWIKALPLPPFYLAQVVAVLYFFIFYPSWLTAFFLVYGLYRLLKSGDRKLVKSACLLCLPFAAFFLTILAKQHLDQKIRPNQIKEIRILPDTIKINGNQVSFRGKAGARTYQAFYKLNQEEEQTFFKRLSSPLILDIEASLEEPSGPSNFYGFDYRTYLRSQGIDQILTINRISHMDQQFNWDPFVYLSSLRRAAIVWIEEHFPAPMKDYMTGLLFAYLGSDFDQMNEIYSRLGIIHLFALSSMQVGFFLNLFRRISLGLGLTRDQLPLAQVFFSIFYAGLTGYSVSVLRSLLQSLLSHLGLRGLDNLGLTFLALFLISPHYLTTAGGVLSCAYAFILSMMDLGDLRGFKRTLVESLALSLGVLPVLLFYFSEFQPWSLLFTFFFSLIFDYALLPILTGLFILSPLYASSLLNPLLDYLELAIRFLSSLTQGPLVFGHPQVEQLLLALFLLGLLYDHWKKRKEALLISLALALLFLWFKFPLTNELTLIAAKGPASLFVRSIDNQSLLINLPSRKTFPLKEEWKKRSSQRELEKTLLPYLKSRGLDRLDYLILTDTENLEKEDLLAFLSQMRVKEVFLDESLSQRQDLLQVLKDYKVKMTYLQNQPLQLGRLGLKKQKDHLSLDFLDYHFLYQTSKKPLTASGYLISRADYDQDVKQHPLILMQADQKSEKEARAGLYQTSQVGAIRLSGLNRLKIETVK